MTDLNVAALRVGQHRFQPPFLSVILVPAGIRYTLHTAHCTLHTTHDTLLSEATPGSIVWITKDQPDRARRLHNCQYPHIPSWAPTLPDVRLRTSRACSTSPSQLDSVTRASLVSLTLCRRSLRSQLDHPPANASPTIQAKSSHRRANTRYPSDIEGTTT